jgi:hypothetical protein
MAAKFQLSAKLFEQISTVTGALNDEIADLREAYDDRSERWREGDAGTDVAAWLDELDELAETLENLSSEPTS